VITISPAPTADEVVAVMAAVQAVLDGERARVPYDPLPAAYRSSWRKAAIHEGAGFDPRSSEVMRVF
jgi:hypothetical protein